MRRFYEFIVILFAFNTVLGAEPSGFTSRFAEHIRVVKGFSGRTENSIAEQGLYRYISDVFRSRAIDFTEIAPGVSGSRHTFSSSLSVFFPGEMPDTLTVAVSLANPSVISAGAPNDAAVAFSIAFSEWLANESSLPVSVRVAFLGSDETAKQWGLAADLPSLEREGSLRLLESLDREVPNVVLYISFPSVSGGMELLNFGTGTVSPYWFFDRVARAARETGIKAAFNTRKYQMYRADLNDTDTKAGMFLSDGIPAMELTGPGDNQADAVNDNSSADVEKLHSFMERFLENNTPGFPDQWDHHYFVIDWFGIPFALREAAILSLTILILVIFVALSVTYSLAKHSELVAFLSGFRKSSYSLVVYFAVAILLLWTVSVALSGMAAFWQMPDVWKAVPGLALFVKAFLFLCAFVSASVVLRRLSLVPDTISFYGVGSLLLFFIDILIFSALDLSYAFYFIVPFACCLLAIIVRRKSVALITLLLSPLPLIPTFVSMAETPFLKPSRLMLSAGLASNVFIAFCLLPFILLLIRCLLVFYFKPSLSPGQRIFLGILPFVALFAVFLVFPLLPLLIPSREKAVYAERVIDAKDGGTRISLSSAIPIGDVTVDADGDSRSFEGIRGKTQVDFPDSKVDISASIDRNAFLGRSRYSVSIAFPEGADRLDMKITADDSFLVYDLNYPFEYLPDGKGIRITVGTNPPDPLLLDVTLPLAIGARLDVASFQFGEGQGFSVTAKNPVVLQTVRRTWFPLD